MDLYIEEWEWDDGNIEHLAQHGVTPEFIEDEIWTEAPKYNANRRGRSASHFMIGPDRGKDVDDLYPSSKRRSRDVASNHRMAKQAT